MKAHLAGQRDLCIVGVAQELGLLLPESQGPLDQGRVVGVGRGRARDEGPVQLLPQRPVIMQAQLSVNALPYACVFSPKVFRSCLWNSVRRRLPAVCMLSHAGNSAIASELTTAYTQSSAPAGLLRQ